METKTIETVLNQMKKEGNLPSKIVLNSSQNSLVEMTNLPPALMTVKKMYPTAPDFIMAINPSRQLQICTDPEKCLFGNSPKLESLNTIYGQGTAEAWLVPEVVDACQFCGLKEMPDNYQLEKLVTIIADKYHYLTIDQLQLFFYWFCSAKYLHFYNSFDPFVIIRSLELFIKDQNDAIYKRDKREKEERREREHQEWLKGREKALEYLHQQDRGKP